ncbi:MAG: NADAR family protein [ANME-2 cluster archaeon]|nr:NADAR family protein [ANME-2 cluster archaeon]
MAENIYYYEETKGRIDGKYRFLSNFYNARMVIHKKEYATVEHYFQSMKHSGTDLEEKIRLAPKPMDAKELAWTRPLPPNWDGIKESIMLLALRAKFGQHPELARKLLDTGDARLHEDSPTDRYWGIKGKDRMGILLMQVRDELREENNG